MIVLLILYFASVTVVYAFPCDSIAECSKLTFWHIPGPNPIVAPHGTDEWDSTECEVAGGVSKINGTYYLIYHCTGAEGYSIGISTSKHPLGPWTIPPKTPNLPRGGPHDWDRNDVASFNIMPDPNHSGQWLGWYEGGPGDGLWSLGFARAPHPLGPWTKYSANPILGGHKVCDKNRSFTGSCGGLYVGSVVHGSHTGGEYWLYLEAPINCNDEGPMALWSSNNPEGPFVFRAYVLDGGDQGGWDSGRYSESRVMYHDGMWHIFASASSVGNPSPNKINEQIGWAFSEDGVRFSEYRSNPIAPYTGTTPHLAAMAEGHGWIEEPFIYVYHTIRWDDNKDPFAPNYRNAEDLGVEVFSISPYFELDMPLITPIWSLSLMKGQESPCSYDWDKVRYCIPIKAIITSSNTETVLHPELKFYVHGNCSGSVSLTVNVHSFGEGGVGEKISSLSIGPTACKAGQFSGNTAGMNSGIHHWIITTITNQNTPISEIQMTVHYSNTKAPKHYRTTQH